MSKTPDIATHLVDDDSANLSPVDGGSTLAEEIEDQVAAADDLCAGAGAQLPHQADEHSLSSSLQPDEVEAAPESQVTLRGF
jgi:hypothetical protein